MAKQKKIELNLDKDEKDTLDAFEAAVETGKLKSIPQVNKEIKRIQTIAKLAGNKNKRVNIRMTAWDFNKAQEKALQEGLPYQTFLASILHKYLTNQFIEKFKH